MKLLLAHASMQASDPLNQIRADARRVFQRAARLGTAWVTGTEAQTPVIDAILREEAGLAGYRYSGGSDVWVAVRRSRIAGSFTSYWQQVIPGKAREYPSRGVLRVTFVDVELGPVTVLTSHYQTRRQSKKHPQHNELLAAEIGRQARVHGAGAALVFYGGDQNIVDQARDTFKGQPLTSTWDELGRWENTGHGNIDVIATFDGDGRVKVLDTDALDDDDLRLNTDHFLVEALLEIRPPESVRSNVTIRPEQKLASPPVIGGHPRKHSGKANHPIERVVIHSAVMHCKPGAARILARMSSEGGGGGSWHYAVDPLETIQCSFDSYICWHAPPNSRSLGIEMADWPVPWPTSRAKSVLASFRRRWRWATPNHRKMLRRTAELTAELCVEYDLPIVFVTARRLGKGGRGITTHAQISKAFKQSTHWDPGAWPQARFMRMTRRHAKKVRGGKA